MIRHFFRLGFRNLNKNKSNTLINVISLSLGIAILLVIAIFTRNELSVDDFHTKSSNICKVSYGDISSTPGPLGALLKENFPEIENATHMETRQLFMSSPILCNQEEPLEISDYYSVDPEFFSVFDFHVLRGDIVKALNTPFSMILTESEASRIFNDEDPIGQTLIWRTAQDTLFTVLAIVSDAPQNSSIQFNGLISEASTKKMTPYYPDNWGFTVYETYLLLNPNIQTEAFENKLRSFLVDYYESNLASYASQDDARSNPLELHSLREVYFNQSLNYDTTNRGNLLLIRILIVIGMVILLLSVVNYSNLTTAKASLRNKEIGVQKVFGSGKKQLIFQFLTETTIISFIAALLGVIIALLLLPGLSRFMNYRHNLSIPLSFLVLLVPGTLLLGILAGIYPSFFLSSQKVIHVLRIDPRQHFKGKHFRFLLLTFQFFVTIALIAFTLLIDRQVSYLRNKDVGIEVEQVLYVRLPQKVLRGKKEVFTERIQQLPNIKNIAYSSRVLGRFEGYNTLELNGRTISFSDVWVDAAFIDLYDLQLVKGRFFREELRADRNATALINEAALRAFDVEDPFAIEIRVPGGYANVVGIVKDFNYKSLHHGIEPLAIIYLPGQGTYANIKLSGSYVSQTLQELEEIWSELAPGFPFGYHFLDNTYEKLYESETRMGKAILYSSLIAMIIAVLGVLSLSLFLCESRMKETAIRKINGAKAWEVVLGLNRIIIVNLLIAFAMATPLAWYLIRRWLDNFAYKCHIGIWIFIVSGTIVSTIALTFVSWRSWRFANRNPTDVMRYE